MRSVFLKLYPLFLFIVAIGVISGCHTAFGIYHTVHKGETLYAISRTYDIPVQQLKEANFLRNANTIYPGEQLFIPGASRVKRVDQSKPDQHTKSAKRGNKRNHGGSSTSIGKSKGKSGSSIAPKNKVVFRWPVEGVLTSGFGPRHGKMHTGIDISAPQGTPIVAAAAGTVIYSDNTQRGFGNMVLIQHDHGFYTVYAHNQFNSVHKGDRVRKGDVIGKVGQTGRTTGPHVHFEIRYHKQPIDPLEYLP